VASHGIAQEPPPDSTTVPISIVGGRPVIEAYINGDGPFKFVLDTGATHTMVSKDLVDRLRLPESGSVLVGAPNSNQLLRAPQHRVRELRIGDLKFFGVKATAILDQNFRAQIRADGVVSAQDFRGYLVTLDYRQRQVVVEPGRLPEADGQTVFDCVEKFGLSAIELDVMGIKTLFHLDTGSPFYIALPGEMLTSLTYDRKPEMVGMASTIAGLFLLYVGKLGGDVKFGKFTIEKPTVEVMDQMPIGNLGYRFFRDYRVTFDYNADRVRLFHWQDAARKSQPPPTVQVPFRDRA
jgi:hypothetical protein